MRILIISKEAWRDEQNGGNVCQIFLATSMLNLLKYTAQKGNQIIQYAKNIIR